MLCTLVAWGTSHTTKFGGLGGVSYEFHAVLVALGAAHMNFSRARPAFWFMAGLECTFTKNAYSTTRLGRGCAKVLDRLHFSMIETLGMLLARSVLYHPGTTDRGTTLNSGMALLV